MKSLLISWSDPLLGSWAIIRLRWSARARRPTISVNGSIRMGITTDRLLRIYFIVVRISLCICGLVGLVGLVGLLGLRVGLDGECMIVNVVVRTACLGGQFIF